MKKMKVSEVKTIAEFLFLNKINTHIDTFDERFYNGHILVFKEEIIIIDDRVLGQIPLAFSTIKFIRKFTK
jgi:hypothetical protein